VTPDKGERDGLEVRLARQLAEARHETDAAGAEDEKPYPGDLARDRLAVADGKNPPGRWLPRARPPGVVPVIPALLISTSR
jgi:hypothetical protein